jgi:hypothetical protein
MVGIDWAAVAKNNGLSPDEFAKEIYMAAATIGAMTLDKQKHNGAVKFTGKDEVGTIELWIKRATNEPS